MTLDYPHCCIDGAAMAVESEILYGNTRTNFDPI